MKFDIPINLVIEASSEAEAEKQLWAFLRYSTYHCGNGYGILDWEAFDFGELEDASHT